MLGLLITSLLQSASTSTPKKPPRVTRKVSEEHEILSCACCKERKMIEYFSVTYRKGTAYWASYCNKCQNRSEKKNRKLRKECK